MIMVMLMSWLNNGVVCSVVRILYFYIRLVLGCVVVYIACCMWFCNDTIGFKMLEHWYKLLVQQYHCFDIMILNVMQWYI